MPTSKREETDAELDARLEREAAARRKEARAKLVAAVKACPLPEGVTVDDLARPSYSGSDPQARADRGRGYEEHLEFELWHTSRFGWCIATLSIGRSRRANQSFSGGERTYGVTLKGEVVTMGNGPHVTARHTVYVRVSRVEALRKFLDLQEKGAASAGDIRDRISTRRAQGHARRGGW